MIQKNYIKFKSSFFQVFISSILINSPFVSSSVLADDNKSFINTVNFEDVFFKNDIKFEDKHNLDNQINSFLGIDYSLDNMYFSDLKLPFTSRDIRKMYDDMLLQMSIKESNKINDIFFQDKL